jgi:Cu/Zn superoxide dismutase
MKTLALSALTLALTLTACNPGPKTVTYSATLSPASEVPAVTATATGSATLTLNEDTKTATLTGSAASLSGDLKGAHIHGPAAVGANAPVLFELEFTNDTAAKSATIKSKGASFALTDAQIADLKAQKYYVNVHTAANGGGEARGQLIPK